MTLPTLNFSRPDGINLEFEIIDVSYSAFSDAPTTHHRHSFYEILFVEEGVSCHSVDFKSYAVAKNEILIIPKNSVHLTTENENYQGQWFLFTDHFLPPEQSKMLHLLSIFNPIIDNKLLKINANTEVLKYIDILKTEYSNGKNNPLLLQNLFFTFLLKLEDLAQTQYATTTVMSEKDTHFSFLTFLENDFRTQHTVTHYTDKLNLTPKKLNKILLKTTGKTTNELILERIMIEAKRLLVYSDQSVKEIAYHLGFEDNHYFSRIFKKKNHVSPETFKNSFAEKSI